MECAIHRSIENNGATVRLRLEGHFDRDGGAQLRRALHDAFVRRRAARIVLDAAAVESIGSECLDLLLVAYTRALKSGLGYETVNAHGTVRLALEAVGLCERADLQAPLPVWAAHLPPLDPASLSSTAVRPAT